MRKIETNNPHPRGMSRMPGERYRSTYRSKYFVSVFAAGLLGAVNLPVTAGPDGFVDVNGRSVLAPESPDNAGLTEIFNDDGAIIHWDSFNISEDEIVRFTQSSDSRVLNQVINNVSGTTINGEILSQGQVYLIDPSGIVVGSQGVINTNGLVLSTLNISDDDFEKGILRFTGPGARVVNEGSIKSGDFVVVAGGGVENSGRITGGSDSFVILAAGESVFIEGRVDSTLTATVDGSEGVAINNEVGIIQAKIVAMLGKTAKNLNQNATTIEVSESGSIEFVNGTVTPGLRPGDPGTGDGEGEGEGKEDPEVPTDPDPDPKTPDDRDTEPNDKDEVVTDEDKKDQAEEENQVVTATLVNSNTQSTSTTQPVPTTESGDQNESSTDTDDKDEEEGTIVATNSATGNTEDTDSKDTAPNICQ